MGGLFVAGIAQDHAIVVEGVQISLRTSIVRHGWWPGMRSLFSLL
jgi:hypothetical protein